MQVLRLAVLVVASLTLGTLGGCSLFKSKKNKGIDDGTQTSGMEEQGGFGEYGVSEANRLKAPYNQSYHFDLNKFDVKQYDVESINVQANYLVAHSGARVRLEGNADERGSREYNIALGWKRARAVAAILKQQGVKDAQIVMLSYGKEKPVAMGHDEEDYRQNRRVDLVYEIK